MRRRLRYGVQGLISSPVSTLNKTNFYHIHESHPALIGVALVLYHLYAMTPSALRLLPFFILSVLHLVGEMMHYEHLIVWTKPLLMPSLIFWWWQVSRGRETAVRQGIVAALSFSTAGDILLMQANQYAHYFLLGLSAFLIAHIFYIRTFLRVLNRREGYLSGRWWMAAPFALYLALLLWMLWAGIPMAMKGAVVVYALVITTMALLALQVRPYMEYASAIWLFLGAVLFVLSDSMIAINKFGHPFDAARVAIMSTYIIGQYAIARGSLGFEAAR